MSKAIAEGGYEAEVKNAEGDSTQQISQIQEFIDQEVSALIIDPVDPYGSDRYSGDCQGEKYSGDFL